MLPAPGNAASRSPLAVSRQPVAEAPELVLAAYHAHQQATGRGNPAYDWAARAFLRRWPAVRSWESEPLPVQLAANASMRPFITFLLVTGRLHPGWDYLVHRKFSSIWRDVRGTAVGGDLEAFIVAARSAGYTERVASAMASQGDGPGVVRHRGNGCRRSPTPTSTPSPRQESNGRLKPVEPGSIYRATSTATRTVLFHMGVLPVLPQTFEQRWPFARRMASVPEPMHSILVRYLQAKSVTCRPNTVSGLATRLAHFGATVAALDPAATPATMDRVHHIEPWLVGLTHAPNTKTGGILSTAEQARRILAVANFFSDISEWDWPEAPARRLLYSSDNPRLPQPLPRFLPPDADRRLTEALQTSPQRLAADALLLQRACGLRIGELLDLELDAVIDTPQAGSWLKVPLGKLDTERMVPIDDEIVSLIDRITANRSPGRPIPHPRTGRPADFLFTAHGHRLGQNGLRMELRRAAKTAGIGHVTPHQLRHTYATALVNAGVSLQALMAILGHVSAEMSLRYGHLFDITIRAEYERSLDLAKTRIGTLPEPARATTHCDTGTAWTDTPTLKTALAGGYCLRAPAQGPCTYANICEHCPSFHTEASHATVLTAQRDQAQVLADDATARGWDSETERHLRLITRINDLLDNAATRPNTM